MELVIMHFQGEPTEPHNCLWYHIYVLHILSTYQFQLLWYKSKQLLHLVSLPNQTKTIFREFWAFHRPIIILHISVKKLYIVVSAVMQEYMFVSGILIASVSYLQLHRYQPKVMSFKYEQNVADMADKSEWNRVTRAPLLYFICSWVALSFKICQWVSE